MSHPTVIDLFCGCGGLSWGLAQVGFQVLAGIDHWQPALKTFQYNHPNAKAIDQDVTQIQPSTIMALLGLGVGELDCLVGGPPCQSFSKNVPASYRFFDDPRNHLYQDFLRFVKDLLPKTVLIENVAEIFNAYGGVIRQEITRSLEELGYQVVVGILYAPDFGVPQRRKRCFFLASRTGVTPTLPPPQYVPSIGQDVFTTQPLYWSAWAAIADLPRLADGEGGEPLKYDQDPHNPYQAWARQNTTLLYDHIARKLQPTQYARFASIEAGQNIRDLPDHLRPKSGYSGAYGRLDFEMLAPTITRWVFHPGSGRFGHPRDIRLITIREAARLQAFSDDFRFWGTYIEKSHQVGNAVPPLLAQALGKSIQSCLAVEESVQSSVLAANDGVLTR